MKTKKNVLVNTLLAVSILSFTAYAEDTFEDRAVQACKAYKNYDYLTILNMGSKSHSKYEKMRIKRTYGGDKKEWLKAKKEQAIKNGQKPKDFVCSVTKTKGKSTKKVYMKKMFGKNNYKLSLKKIDKKWLLK